MTQSWYLDNADLRAQQHKYTFYKPSQTVIDKLLPGDKCKLIFDFDSANPDHPAAERMWVMIDNIYNQTFTGHLESAPLYIQDLKAGDTLKFESKHIVDVSIDDDEPNIVEKYVDKCFTTKRIIFEESKIGYLHREEPMPGEKDGFKDSGWRFLEGDENQESLDNSTESRFVSLGLILNNDDSFIDLLNEAIGSAFIRDKVTNEFIRLD